MGTSVDLTVDLDPWYMIGRVSGDRWIRAFFTIGDVHEEAFCLEFEALSALAKGVILFRMSVEVE